MIYRDDKLSFYRKSLEIDGVSFEVVLHSNPHVKKISNKRCTIFLGNTSLSHKKNKFIIKSHRVTKHIHPCLYDDMFILLEKCGIKLFRT